MAIPREPDRLVLFTDAVVAIAVTLLVLPLVDVVPQASEAGQSAIEVITEHQPEIWSFLLSFAVIMRLWMAHHRLFQHVRAYSTPLIVCNLGWLLTIIVLPFPTEMAGVYSGERFTPLFYIGTILVATGFQLALTLIARTDPEVASESRPVTPEQVAGSLTVTALLATALLLVLIIPGLGYWTLLLLFLSSRIEKLWLRHYSRD
ncbi:DUF1211 domain-containing protein [Actinomadura graeca]|uniref:DUF1211 domain-containing protein n=1 Tax=Actinomadura graeca TaxID=2750812 RepID=A0ABX8QRZ8_9ACTN|nr:TMEM175 family protein [Actinomadura graeca]QXJ21176.1 DUF1211 domain-containing protein [Actinomadura graeca]